MTSFGVLSYLRAPPPLIYHLCDLRTLLHIQRSPAHQKHTTPLSFGQETWERENFLREVDSSEAKAHYSWWSRSPRRLASRALRELPGDFGRSGGRSLRVYCTRFELTVPEWRRASRREHLICGSRGCLTFAKVTLPTPLLARFGAGVFVKTPRERGLARGAKRGLGGSRDSSIPREKRSPCHFLLFTICIYIPLGYRLLSFW